jgi:hypothetical protein
MLAMNTPNEPDGSLQSQGGKARAAKLSKEELKNIAKAGADARWGIPKATHEGVIQIGENLQIPCAVLEDGRRVLTQSGFMKALGRARQAKGRAYYDSDVNMPAFLTAKNLKPFIPKDLEKTSSQIEFRQVGKGGPRAFGYPAELLPAVCEVFLKARDAGELAPTQAHIAKQAEFLIRGLANVGIVALVDEATGFQDVRTKNALAEILEQFIAKELQAWTRTFPVEFYKNIFRLRGWPFNPDSVKRPGVIGKYTNDIVYDRLAPGVLAELKRINPRVDGRRKHKHYNWLTGEVGHPKLLAHLEGVKLLMKLSPTWEQFRSLLDEHYPKISTTDLGFDVEVRKVQPKRLTS